MDKDYVPPHNLCSSDGSMSPSKTLPIEPTPTKIRSRVYFRKTDRDLLRENFSEMLLYTSYKNVTTAKVRSAARPELLKKLKKRQI